MRLLVDLLNPVEMAGEGLAVIFAVIILIGEDHLGLVFSDLFEKQLSSLISLGLGPDDCHWDLGLLHAMFHVVSIDLSFLVLPLILNKLGVQGWDVMHLRPSIV